MNFTLLLSKAHFHLQAALVHLWNCMSEAHMHNSCHLVCPNDHFSHVTCFGSYGLNVLTHRIFDQNWSNFVDTSEIWHCYFAKVSHTWVRRPTSKRTKAHVMQLSEWESTSWIAIFLTGEYTNSSSYHMQWSIRSLRVQLTSVEKFSIRMSFSGMSNLTLFEGCSPGADLLHPLTDCICTWVHFEGMETPLRGVQRIITVFHCFWRTFLVYVGLENHEKDMVIPWYSIDTSHRCSCFEVFIC